MSGNYVNQQSDTGDDASLKANGAEKYARLAALKYRFDPDNLFRLNQNVAPFLLISRSLIRLAAASGRFMQ